MMSDCTSMLDYDKSNDDSNEVKSENKYEISKGFAEYMAPLLKSNKS